MAIDRRKTLLFSSAGALRFLLFSAFPSLPDLLTGMVEVSTPVTSFKRCKYPSICSTLGRVTNSPCVHKVQEGLFLYTHNLSPYDGGVFHQSPLLLPLFALIPSPAFSLVTKLVYIAVDLFCADAVMRIACSGASQSSSLFTSTRKGHQYSSIAIGSAYLFNPFSIAACLGRTTAAFTNCAILHAIAYAVEGNSSKAMLALALASHLSLHPALLLPPVILLCYDQRKVLQQKGIDARPFVIRLIMSFFLCTAWFLLMSFVLTGQSWEFLRSTYGVRLLLPDLTPNVGLWWYFFIEMFDSFRSFFLGVFWIHLGCYGGGLSIRLRKQPLFVITTLAGIFAIFQPYPSISDTALYFALLPQFRHLFPLMRYTFLAIATVIYATLLGPAFYFLWIYAGSGNANFFYAITLVWSLGLSIIVAEGLFAALRDEWEVERPEMRDKEARQI